MPKTGLGVYMNKFKSGVGYDKAHVALKSLLVFASGSTSNNFNQLAGNGGLTLSVVQDLESEERSEVSFAITEIWEGK